MKNVFLLGFMGSGKSTIGQLLADLLLLPFVDLDDVLIQHQARTITEIFATEGESYFRDREMEILQHLPLNPAAVYATGGGVVLRAENRRVMKEHGQTVYLQADWRTLESRLCKSAGRPLVDAVSLDTLQQIWVERQPLYDQADLVVPVNGLTPAEIAQNIATLLAPPLISDSTGLTL